MIEHSSICSKGAGWGLYTKGDITVNISELQLATVTERKAADFMDEAMLVAVARAGDSSAFVELSQRCSRRVLLKIYRITNDWQDAEDVLQEALMRAFIHLGSFECRASFSTWFTRIAMNTALMLIRKEKRLLRSANNPDCDIFDQDESWQFRDDRDNPEQNYTRQQRAEMLGRAIRRLPPALRRILELQQADELSIKEIAVSLGISEPAAKSRLLRARIALREFVQKETPRCYSFPGPRATLRRN